MSDVIFIQWFEGGMLVSLDAFIEDKPKASKFKKLVKLANESDSMYNNECISKIKEVIEYHIDTNKKEISELKKNYNLECLKLEKEYDPPHLTYEQKRGMKEKLKKAKDELTKRSLAKLKHLTAQEKRLLSYRQILESYLR